MPLNDGQLVQARFLGNCSCITLPPASMQVVAVLEMTMKSAFRKIRSAI